jgi:hypothetical protein
MSCFMLIFWLEEQVSFAFFIPFILQQRIHVIERVVSIINKFILCISILPEELIACYVSILASWFWMLACKNIIQCFWVLSLDESVCSELIIHWAYSERVFLFMSINGVNRLLLLFFFWLLASKEQFLNETRIRCFESLFDVPHYSHWLFNHFRFH